MHIFFLQKMWGCFLNKKHECEKRRKNQRKKRKDSGSTLRNILFKEARRWRSDRKRMRNSSEVGKKRLRWQISMRRCSRTCLVEMHIKQWATSRHLFNDKNPDHWHHQMLKRMFLIVTFAWWIDFFIIVKCLFM